MQIVLQKIVFLTSFSMIFSTYSKVCKVGSPVTGSETSWVRWTIFSSSTVSFSRTVTCPGRSLIAIRGNFKRLFEDFVIRSPLDCFFVLIESGNKFIGLIMDSFVIEGDGRKYEMRTTQWIKTQENRWKIFN